MSGANHGLRTRLPVGEEGEEVGDVIVAVEVLGRQHGTGVCSDRRGVIHDAGIVVRTELPHRPN